jgi:hypothetical protein
LESRAQPPEMRDAVWSLVPLFILRAALGLVALATVSLVLASTSGAAARQPDPAPTPLALTPDPVPGAAPTTPAPVQRVAPTSGEQRAPIPTVAPAPARASSNPAPSAPAGAASTARERAAKARLRQRAERRRHRERIEAAAVRRRAAAAKREAAALDEAAARRGSFVRLGSLIPSTESADDTHSGILLVAGGALLAIVLASGSLLSVATRRMKGTLR